MARVASSGAAGSGSSNRSSAAAKQTEPVKRTGQGRTMHITDSKGNTKHVYAGQTYSTAEAAQNARSEDAAIRAEQAQQRSAWNPFLDEAPQTQQSRYSQEANRERTEEQKAKDAKRETAKSYLDEANRLEQEKASKSDVWENGIYIGMDKATSDEYDRKIAEARSKSDEALAEVNTSDKQRDDIVAAYLKAVDDENAIAGFATDPMSQQAADAARVAREQAEDALKEENRRLGNDVYFGLADEAQSRDLFEGWAGERAAGSAAALGTGLEWLGEKTNVDPFSDAGDTLFNAAQGWQGQAQEDWASGTEDMSEQGKQIAGLGKTAADMTMDMVENMILPGAGRVAMAARVAGGGALTQADRERNDVDARMTKAILDGGVAFLSEYLLGGAEQVYGKSVVGKGLEKMFGKASPVLKTILNTEGLEEGLEYALGYLGDKLLKLDPNGEFSGDELKQNMLVGYIMGVLFNGIAGGIEYGAPKLKAVVDEAYNAVSQDIPPQEAAQMAMLEPDENVQIKSGTQVEQTEESLPDISPEEEQRIDSAVQQAESEQRTPEQAAVADTLMNPKGENGRLSNSQVNQILNDPDAYQAFLAVTGLTDADIKGATNSETRNNVKDAAAAFVQNENTMAEARDRARAYRSSDTDAELQGIIDEVNGWSEPEAEQTAPAETTAQPGATANNANLTPKENAIVDEIDRVAAERAELQEWNDSVYRPGTEEKYYDRRTGKEVSLEEVQEKAARLEELNNRFDELVEQAPSPERMQQASATAAETETTAETNANGMPRNEGNGQTGQNQGKNNATQNPFFNNGNQQQNNNDTSAPGTGKEKTSQFFSNNLTRREGADVRSPLTYLTKTEAETLQNAMYRLNMNGDAEMATMMASTMWSDEQVKMGKIIGQNLLNEARSSGDWAAYDAWRKVEREHATAIARALRAYGRDPDAEMNAEGIAKMAANYFSMLRDDIRAAQESGGKLAQGIDVDLETIDAAQAAVTNATNILGDIEAEEANLRNQGFSDEEIFDRVKDRYLDIAQEIIAKQYGGFILDDITGKNADVRDGVEEATTILRNLLATESPEYIRNYVKAVIGGITTDVQYMGRPTAAQRAKQVSSIQKLCQLFALGTTKRNLLGNATFGLFDWASNNTAGALADSVISLFTGQRTRGLETGIFGGRNYKNGFEAARRSALEIAANLDMKDDGKYISGTSAFSKYDVGGRFMAKANQLLGYALNTTDAAFVGFNEQSASDAALRANDRRGGEMTEETAQKIGENEAEFRTFKNTTATQKAVESIRNVLDLIGWGGEVTHFQGTNIPNGRKGGFGLGTYIAPYIGVPVNLGLKIAEYSPLGAAKGAVEAGQAIKGARNAGGNAQALQDAMVLQNKASGNIGRGLFGTAVVLLLKSLMKQAREEGTEWFKDWNLEKDSAIKAQNNAEGKSGQQVNRSMLQRILNGEPAGKWESGDDLVNMSAIEPMNQTLALASLLADDEHSSSFKDYLKALGTATVDSLQDLPAIASLTQISDTINYNKEYDTTFEENEEGELVENREVNWGRTLGNAGLATIGKSASGFIPAPVRHAASIQDEYQRDTRGDNAAETAWNQVVNSIPTFEVGGRTFGRGSLPVKTDAFGNPISQGDIETRKKNAFNALKYSQLNQTPESEEINRLYGETGKSLMQSASGPKTVTFGSGDKKRTVELSGDEGRSYAQGRNKAFEQNVGEMMNNPVYQNVDTDMQLPLMTEVEDYVKMDAKSKVAQQNGIEYNDKYEGIRKLDDPIGYIGVNKGFNLADSKGKYDVVDMLVPEIQGMSQADRDYLRDKNSTAMSYYDFLTPNKHGEKASSAEVVHDYKVAAKENADKRGVQSASGVDKFKALYDGYYDGKYNDDDVAAFMTKQQSDGDYDATKGRVAVFLAALASGKNTSQALQLAKSADIDNDGTINEKTVYIKGKKEATKTLKKGDLDKNGWDVFNEIMYPNKRR